VAIVDAFLSLGEDEIVDIPLIYFIPGLPERLQPDLFGASHFRWVPERLMDLHSAPEEEWAELWVQMNSTVFIVPPLAGGIASG
jgi:hypothetical protein